MWSWIFLKNLGALERLACIFYGGGKGSRDQGEWEIDELSLKSLSPKML